jgi:hypothetical protein
MEKIKMTNPNNVTFIARTSNNKYVTEYGYTSGSTLFILDYNDMVRVYGKENVKTERRNSYNWIVVTQVLQADKNEANDDLRSEFSVQ